MVLPCRQSFDALANIDISAQVGKHELYQINCVALQRKKRHAVLSIDS